MHVYQLKESSPKRKIAINTTSMLLMLKNYFLSMIITLNTLNIQTFSSGGIFTVSAVREGRCLQFQTINKHKMTNNVVERGGGNAQFPCFNNPL